MDGFELQLQRNADLIAKRKELGDKVRTPREIEHFAYFRRHRAGQAAALELDDAGFDVFLHRKVFGKSALIATKIAMADLKTANDLSRTVYEIVRKHLGKYDGWGAVIIE